MIIIQTLMSISYNKLSWFWTFSACFVKSGTPFFASPFEVQVLYQVTHNLLCRIHMQFGICQTGLTYHLEHHFIEIDLITLLDTFHHFYFSLKLFHHWLSSHLLYSQEQYTVGKCTSSARPNFLAFQQLFYYLENH